MEVEVRALIAAPVETVAACATEPSNDPVWIGGIKTAKQITDGPIAVGTRVERIASFLGKRIEYVLEVTELTPSRFVMRSVKSPFPMVVTYSFDADGDGTRMGIRVEGDPKGFYSLGGPLMRRAVRRNLTKDLERLREIQERHGRAG